MICCYDVVDVKLNECTAAEQIAEPPARRRVVCYPVQLATPAPLPAAIVERKEQGEMTTVTFRGDTQRLNTPYFHKLVSAGLSANIQ